MSKGSDTYNNLMSNYIKNLRKIIGNQLLLLPSVTCLIVDNNERILLQERADTKDWSIPGGFIDPNETVRKSLKREMLEETNLKIINPTLLGIYSGSDENIIYPNGDKCASVRSVFIATEFKGRIKHNQESISLKFFSISNLPTLHSIHSKTLADYLKYKKGEINIPIIE